MNTVTDDTVRVFGTVFRFHPCRARDRLRMVGTGVKGGGLWCVVVAFCFNWGSFDGCSIR